jgi:hypothetical protein
MCGSQFEIVVGSQKRQVMPDAQLRDHRVDRSNSNPGSAARVAKLGGGYVVFPVGLEQRKCGEAFDDLCGSFRAREALQQLLKNKTGGDHHVAACESFFELLHLRLGRRGISTHRERPNTGVDEKRHDRERRAL